MEKAKTKFYKAYSSLYDYTKHKKYLDILKVMWEEECFNGMDRYHRKLKLYHFDVWIEYLVEFSKFYNLNK